MGTSSLEVSRRVMIDVSHELLEAANDAFIELRTERDLSAARARAALRLVQSPKLGFEHVYFGAIETLRTEQG